MKQWKERLEEQDLKTLYRQQIFALLIVPPVGLLIGFATYHLVDDKTAHILVTILLSATALGVLYSVIQLIRDIRSDQKNIFEGPITAMYPKLEGGRFVNQGKGKTKMYLIELSGERRFRVDVVVFKKFKEGQKVQIHQSLYAKTILAIFEI